MSSLPTVTPYLFDTHCHLDFPQFSDEFDAHLTQASEAGVERILVPATGPDNWSRVSDLSQSYSQIYYSLGFHPYFLSRYDFGSLVDLESELASANSHCVAIGECGLDGKVDVDVGIQEQFLLAQFTLAQQGQWPLILHASNAHNRLIQLLKKHKVSVGGVLHGFSGSYQQAMAYVDLGFKIGVGGTITYPRANKTRRTITQLATEHLVLETDSPDMPLFGHQGRNNHPKMLPNILRELSLLKNESESSLVATLCKTSNQAFGLGI